MLNRQKKNSNSLLKKKHVLLVHLSIYYVVHRRWKQKHGKENAVSITFSKNF